MKTLLRLSLPMLGLLAAPLLAQANEQEHQEHNVLRQLPWRELGPVAFGGRIVDLEVHPKDHATFWAAAASGGLWKTTNGGLSFTPQFQDLDSISIGDLAVAPSAPDTLYVGTGEANNQRSSYWGHGLYKSTDGGATWTHLGLVGTEHIGRVAVHPSDPNVVFVAALGALYSANETRGLYRTLDGGATFERVLAVSADVGCCDVAIDPSDPTVVLAATYERRRRAWDFQEGGPKSRVYRSEDGGATFAEVTAGLPSGDIGRIGLAIHPRQPGLVYLSVENLNPAPAAEQETPPAGDADARLAAPDSETLADPLALLQFEARQAQDPERRPRRRTVGGEVYRSDDSGKTFRKTSTKPVGGEPMYYYGQIRLDPSDTEAVYVLGVPVFRSTDGGKTFTPGARDQKTRQEPFHGNLHVDHHALWIDPDDSRHALLGNDGGLAVTWDAGKSWDHLAHLPIAQFYTVTSDRSVPYRVYGGLQDNGTWGFPIRAPQGLTQDLAFRIDGGDGFCVASDPDDPDVLYSESQFGGMSRQNRRTGERKSIRPKAQEGMQPLRFNWMTPLLLSPHNSQTVYVGSQFVHRSRDRGDHWRAISPDLSTNDADKKKGDVPHCTITMIAESPCREGRLYVGTDDGRVWTSPNGGERWIELTDRFPGAVAGLWVSRIEASAHAEGTAFVAFSGYREDRREPLLFRTDDGGETFLPIHDGLPQEPVNVVRQHPSNASLLFVGTEMGAYASLDGGAHWGRLGHSLPRAPVHDLHLARGDEHLLAATHGRGIWALDVRGLAALDPAALARDFVALPPSPGYVLPRAFSRGYRGARVWRADNPFTTATFRYCLREDHDQKVQVEVLDATGAVLFRREMDAKAGYHEVPWRQERQQGLAGIADQAMRRGRQQGQRPGDFAVRIRLGEDSQTLPFSVLDERAGR